MKTLVTGGAGYIGSTVASALLDAGHTPIILDSLVTGKKEFTTDRIFYQGDIADHNLLTKIITDHPDIECCMHFAARTIVGESVAQPYLYYTENLVKSIALFNSLHLLGITKIIFSSSASLYKETEQGMVTEESPVDPLSPYARTKLAVEMVLEDFCNAGHLRGISLRYFNPIGADKQMRTGPFVAEPSHILGKLVNTALGTEPAFHIMGADWQTRDGTAIRDYIHIWDLSRAHVLAAEKFDTTFTEKNSAYSVINLGSGKGVTVKEFVEAFLHVWGKEMGIKYTNRRPGDVVGAYAVCTKAEALLGWRANFSVEEGIRDALHWTNRRNHND